MRSDKGQSLMEVIVASAVGILVVTALTFATIFSLRNANSAKNSAQATKLAQEGIERVRTGRDRNSNINNAPNIPGCTGVLSWNGNTTPSSDIWSCQIKVSGGCDNPLGGKCYFKIDSTGVLTNIDSAFVPTVTTPLPVLSEGIPATNPVFRRVVLLSDESTTYTNQKTVTVIVTWTDFAGTHESKLTTVLRKL